MCGLVVTACFDGMPADPVLLNVSTHLLRYLASSAAKRERDYPSKTEVRQLLRESGFSSIVTRPGVLPLLGWTSPPNFGILRGLAHTTFFVATRT